MYQRIQRIKPFLGLLVAVGFTTLPSAAASSAVPGMLNYVEGQVTMAGQPVTSKSVGSMQLEPNQVMETGQGRAEILLTPGIFLRIGDHSSIRMISPSLADTRVQVLRGEAIVEAAQVFDDSNIRMLVDGASVKLTKHGLYAFDADAGRISVFDGKAVVEKDDQQVDLKKGRQVALTGPLKATHFDTKVAESQDQLYAWSRLRSEYDAEAAMQSARTVVVDGPGWWGPGWYWNPWWGMYSFLPGSGILYSPFGWPYYSPGFRYGYGRSYGRGFAGRGFAGGVPAFHSGGFAARGVGGGGFHHR
jgi:hypothetical protein